jgi:hypothetical protein
VSGGGRNIFHKRKRKLGNEEKGNERKEMTEERKGDVRRGLRRTQEISP